MRERKFHVGQLVRVKETRKGHLWYWPGLHKPFIVIGFERERILVWSLTGLTKWYHASHFEVMS